MNDMEKKQTLLLIPYLRAGAQGGELETAVNGWLKYFQGDLRICVIGDDTPITRKLQREGKITVAVLPRRAEDASEPALDIVRKMKWAISYFDGEFDGCIWSNDDIYPVAPVTISDIKVLKGVGADLTGNISSPNHFQRAMYRTREVLQSVGRPVYNYSSHCPRWFYFKRLATLMNSFALLSTPLLIESLYFNYWYTNPKAVRVNVNKPGNRFKCGLYTDDHEANLRTLKEALERGVLFVNHSPKGWSEALILAIRAHYNK